MKMKLKSQSEINETEMESNIDYSPVTENNRFGYIYLTTNDINGKVYIGKCENSHFKSEYLGSGLNLGRSIAKYGIRSFSVMVLVYVSTLKELNELEKKFVARYREALGRENVYNIADGGDGGKLRLGMKGNFREGSHHTDEAKRKIGEANKGTIHSPESIAQQKESRKWYKATPEIIEKQRQGIIASWTPERHEAAKGKIPWNKGTGTSHLRSTAPKTGKHQSPLQIQKRNAWKHLLPTDQPPILPVVVKIPKIRKPNPPITEETRQKLRDLAAANRNNNILSHTGANNVRFGKKHTPETIAKMRAKALLRTHTEETKAKLSALNLGKTAWNKGIAQTEEVKKKISSTLSGRHLSEETKKKISDWNQSHPHSAEARKKISDAVKARRAKQPSLDLA